MKKLNKTQKKKIKDNIFKVLHILGYISMGLLIVIFIIVGVNGCGSSNKENTTSIKSNFNTLGLNQSYNSTSLYNINSDGNLQINSGDMYLFNYSYTGEFEGYNHGFLSEDSDEFYLLPSDIEFDEYDDPISDFDVMCIYYTYYTNEENEGQGALLVYEDFYSYTFSYFHIGNGQIFGNEDTEVFSPHLVHEVNSGYIGDIMFMVFPNDMVFYSSDDKLGDFDWYESYRFFNGYGVYVDSSISFTNYNQFQESNLYNNPTKVKEYCKFVNDNFDFGKNIDGSQKNVYLAPIIMDYSQFASQSPNSFVFFPILNNFVFNSDGQSLYNTEFYLTNFLYFGRGAHPEARSLAHPYSETNYVVKMPFEIGNPYHNQYFLNNLWFQANSEGTNGSGNSWYLGLTFKVYCGFYKFHNLYVNFLQYCYQVPQSLNTYQGLINNTFNLNFSISFNAYSVFRDAENGYSLLGQVYTAPTSELPNGLVSVLHANYKYLDLFRYGTYRYNGINYDMIRIGYGVAGYAYPWTTMYINESAWSGTSKDYMHDPIVDCEIINISLLDIYKIGQCYNPSEFLFLKSNISNVGVLKTKSNSDGGGSGSIESSGLGSVFTLLGTAFSSIADLFNISIFGAFTLGSLIFLPLVVMVVLFIVKMFKR